MNETLDFKRYRLFGNSHRTGKTGSYNMAIKPKEDKKMKKFATSVLSAVLMLSCACSCSNAAERETSIVYVGPNGETLEEPYKPSYDEDDENETEEVARVSNETEEKAETEETAETSRETEFDEEAEIDKAIENAETLLSEGKYDAAIVSLIEVKNRVSNKSRIYAEEERINSFRPVYIYDLEPMTSTESDYLDLAKWHADDTLNTGECGKTGICAKTHELLAFIGFRGKSRRVTSANYEYYINGQYDRVTGIYALSGLTNAHKNTKFTLNLNIYADNVLIYSSKYITKGSLPIPVDVDLPAGTQLVKIEFVTNTTNIKGSISVENQYGSAFVDAAFSKKYTPIA